MKQLAMVLWRLSGGFLHRAAGGLLFGLALLFGAAQAEGEEAPDYAGATLSGDWGGRRSSAWQKGWAFDAAFRLDALNSRGGLRAGDGAMSNLDLMVKADLTRVAGWPGATAYLHLLDNRGAGVNARYTGSLMGTSNIEVPVPTARLFHAWLQQNFFDEQFSLLAGLYPIDAEFFAMESASRLVHPAFGTPADLALSRAPSVFNNSAFGLRAKWLSTNRTLYAMGAVLDGVPNDPAHPRRTTVDLSRSDGALVIAELGWMPLEYAHVFEPTEPVQGLPTPALFAHEKYGGVSKYAVGFWRYTNRVPDMLAVDSGGAPLRSPSQGAYLLAERSLFGLGDEPGRDVALFARYSLSDGDTVPVSRSWSVGVRWRGPLAWRPDDVLSLGGVYSPLAGKYRLARAAFGEAAAYAEQVVELSWRAAINRYFAVQPVILSLAHPGGGAGASRATVLGVRLELAL